MKIRSMTATFGKLDHARLELGDGLNLIYAPNEGGKSTWAAFWKAMLYGIDTRDRDKKGYLADKNRYQPWSGAPMEGTMDLEWQDRDITLRRGPKGSAPFGAFSAVYTGTEEAVPGLTAANCGELLTGVGREVFERSAFIGSGGDLAVTAAPELERRIAALVSSGEEDVSYSQTEKTLRGWLNRRRHNKTGLIPRLEEAGRTLVANVPVYVTQIEKWWGGVIAFAAGHGITLPELSMNVDNATKVITDFLTNNGDNVVNTTIDITTSILGALVNFLLALVFSVYLLAQKETLMAQAKRLLLAAIPKKSAGRTMHILSLTNNAFSSFVTGQVTEAFILGTLCCLGMLILRLPYALPVSVIISFTSLIPIFGAWIGAATGAFLIVFVSPIKALTFLIFLLILQQVEGNLIYPRVVGKSVGLPGLWVLAAVTIGGGAFGVVGMLLGVPVCSVVYALVQDFIRSRSAEESRDQVGEPDPSHPAEPPEEK